MSQLKSMMGDIIRISLATSKIILREKGRSIDLNKGHLEADYEPKLEKVVALVVELEKETTKDPVIVKILFPSRLEADDEPKLEEVVTSVVELEKETIKDLAVVKILFPSRLEEIKTE
ncbi:hypothetical protein EPI10_032149 [Gossypium australe]|uniref:Uncharacterized protein n=1 Tax=Gossypium australe TaxID=47621 RepID=A0A5B6X2K0_9ROSI|nr:hypothetical protein EPI10_032149 [Gossypium australe]